MTLSTFLNSLSPKPRNMARPPSVKPSSDGTMVMTSSHQPVLIHRFAQARLRTNEMCRYGEQTRAESPPYADQYRANERPNPTYSSRSLCSISFSCSMQLQQ